MDQINLLLEICWILKNTEGVLVVILVKVDSCRNCADGAVLTVRRIREPVLQFTVYSFFALLAIVVGGQQLQSSLS